MVPTNVCMSHKQTLPQLIDAIRPLAEPGSRAGRNSENIAALIRYLETDLVDAITNMIDENIRKSRCGNYDEWQAAVQSVLTAQEEEP